jgi:hypothetical protein
MSAPHAAAASNLTSTHSLSSASLTCPPPANDNANLSYSGLDVEDQGGENVEENALDVLYRAFKKELEGITHVNTQSEIDKHIAKINYEAEMTELKYKYEADVAKLNAKWDKELSRKKATATYIINSAVAAYATLDRPDPKRTRESFHK